MSDREYPGDDAIIIAIYDHFGVSMFDAERWFKSIVDPKERVAELTAEKGSFTASEGQSDHERQTTDGREE